MAATEPTPAVSRFLSAHSLAISLHPVKGRSLTTTRPLPRGTRVVATNALATVAVDPATPCCHWCLRRADGSFKQLRCTACRKATYCSVACQKKDWAAGHKVVCPVWKARSTGSGTTGDEESDDAVHDEEMLSKVAFALSRPTPLADLDGQVGRDLFLSLTSHSTDWDTDTQSAFSHIASRVLHFKFPNAAQPPTHTELTHHLGRFRCNNYSIHDPELFVLAEGTFPLGGLLNHSCHPNCLVAYEGRSQILRTIRDVEAGEELNVTYVDAMEDREGRRKSLWSKYRFWCRCERCGEGGGDGDDGDVLAERVGQVVSLNRDVSGYAF
ncbi:SET and MYND domain-containing protein 3, partial [Borealophlyctis nickersoniae]